MIKQPPDKYFQPLDEEEKSLMEVDDGEDWNDSNSHKP